MNVVPRRRRDLAASSQVGLTRLQNTRPIVAVILTKNYRDILDQRPHSLSDADLVKQQSLVKSRSHACVTQTACCSCSPHVVSTHCLCTVN
jgi:hypothetical protein